jgi:hypothetical protein
MHRTFLSKPKGDIIIEVQQAVLHPIRSPRQLAEIQGLRDAGGPEANAQADECGARNEQE